MIYIAGKQSKKKEICIYSLRRMFGLNYVLCMRVLSFMGISNKRTFKRFSKVKYKKILMLIKTLFLVEYDLKRSLISQRKHLRQMKHYRGLRSFQGLPVRGQRTHTNAQIARYKLAS